MIFDKHSPNARYFNWLIHHRYMQDIRKYRGLLRGRLLDIGCGRKPYFHELVPYCDQYVGIEYVSTLHSFSEVDVIGDALALPFKDESFDCAVSFQVMEHIRDPFVFMSEIFRVVNPGSFVLLMTPFIWREHEAPFDFYRYTRYGLAHLAEHSGFEVREVTPHTRFCETTTLLFNYWIKRYGIGPLEYLLMPFLWADQLLAIGVDNIDSLFARLAGQPQYTVATAGFTTLLQKPAH